MKITREIDSSFLIEIISNILKDFENDHHIFAIFVQAVYAIEKLLANFNVQTRIGMNQALI